MGLFDSLFGGNKDTAPAPSAPVQETTVQAAPAQVTPVVPAQAAAIEPRRVRIVETVLRDGHQSLLATRMRTRHMQPVLEALDAVGYEALECWGGATFDSMVRFLDENPWDRLRILKQHVKNTPLQMLLRGQNLLGYTHYSDDVVRDFIFRMVDQGIDRVRVFDALNDVRNMESSIRYAKEAGAHVQGAMVYTISPVHTEDAFINVARHFVEVGADSLCIKDMSGLLAPFDAERLVRRLKAEFDIPVDLHSHFTTGLADLTYLKGVEAGVDIIDTALSPFSSASSQPSTESIVMALKDTPYDTGLDLAALESLATYFRGVRKEIEEEFGIKAASEIIPEVRKYQIPGGMLSNTRNQLKEMGMEDRFFEVLEEMPRVRADLGYPPLVTPTSQIVGTMATMNVMMGQRYKMVPNEVKDIVRGKYGTLPAPISEEIKQLIIGDEPVITHRPADDIPAQMDTFRQTLAEKGFVGITEEDVITYAMLPEQALLYFERHRR